MSATPIIPETIRTRRSVRTFDGRALSPEDIAELKELALDIPNPYGLPVRFVFLDAAEHGLSTKVIKGEKLYVAAMIGKAPHSEEAYGFSFEKLVLRAWERGIGTTWIGGTMDRKLFEKEAGVKENEMMYCVSPLGYPAQRMSIIEIAMRRGISADKRKSASELFFDGDFAKPLIEKDEGIAAALEMVRLAPSAVNLQPWRIVKRGGAFHFYIRHRAKDPDRDWDIQMVDMGIALCHFTEGVPGRLVLDDPGIPAPPQTDYVATIEVDR